MRRRHWWLLTLPAALSPAGCGDALTGRTPALFGAEILIDGVSIGPAVVDTGGGYEVILREPFGLSLVGTADVLAFGGRESVDVTEGFSYATGGWLGRADGALVGVSVCDCNGLGFHFFRKSGAVLELDFAGPSARFLDNLPNVGVVIPFASPPPQLPGFDTSFVEVEVSTDVDSRPVVALIDTGTTRSVMRRGLLSGRSVPLQPDRLAIRLTEPSLGTVALQVELFDTPGLPDLIIGTDVMPIWADRWYFAYFREGGVIRAVLPARPNDAGGVLVARQPAG